MRILTVAGLAIATGCTLDHDLGRTSDDDPPDPGPPARARWAVPLGDAGDDIATSVCIDEAGDVVVLGAFRGAADLGGGLLSASSPDALMGYLTKRSGADGAHVWSVSLGEAKGAGNIVPVSNGGLVVIAAPTLYMLEGDGTVVWQRELPPEAAGVFATSAVASDGTIVAAGAYAGTVDLGNGPETGADAGSALVVAYSASGERLWGRAFAGPSWALGLAIAANGDVIVTGGLTGPTAVGTTMLVPGQREGGFVARLDSQGAVIWARVADPLEHEPAVYRQRGVTVDANDRIVLTGNEKQDVSPYYIYGQTRVLDETGDLVWLRSTENAESFATSVGAEHDVVVGGLSLVRHVEFGGLPLDLESSTLHGGMFVGVRGSDGTPVGVMGFPDGGSLADSLLGLATSDDGVAIVGYFDDLDVGTGRLTSSGVHDGFVAMFDWAE